MRSTLYDKLKSSSSQDVLSPLLPITIISIFSLSAALRISSPALPAALMISVVVKACKSGFDLYFPNNSLLLSSRSLTQDHVSPTQLNYDQALYHVVYK